MKKILTISIMLFSFISTISSNEISIRDYISKKDIYEYITVEESKKDYCFSSNKNLLEYIEIDSTSIVPANKIYNTFCCKMNESGSIIEKNKKEKQVVKNIHYVVKGMRRYLNDMEYREFLRFLNITMYNRGFIKESYIYCEKY